MVDVVLERMRPFVDGSYLNTFSINSVIGVGVVLQQNANNSLYESQRFWMMVLFDSDSEESWSAYFRKFIVN